MTQSPRQLFPLFLTDKLASTKAYYVEKLGFSVTFDLPQYLQVRYGSEEGAPEVCFMLPNAFPDGVARPAFGGQGVVVSIPTESADAAHDRMASRGAQVESAPSDKPWGWRSFFVRDPSGVVLDFFHTLPVASVQDMK